jgi:hypothetical protein
MECHLLEKNSNFNLHNIEILRSVLYSNQFEYNLLYPNQFDSDINITENTDSETESNNSSDIIFFETESNDTTSPFGLKNPLQQLEKIIYKYYQIDLYNENDENDENDENKNNIPCECKKYNLEYQDSFSEIQIEKNRYDDFTQSQLLRNYFTLLSVDELFPL